MTWRGWIVVLGLVAWAAILRTRVDDWQTDHALWMAEWAAQGEPFRAAMGLRADAIRRGDLEGAITWCQVAWQVVPTERRAQHFVQTLCPSALAARVP